MSLIIKNVDNKGASRDINQMIRLWKKALEKEDLIYELKKREYFLNASAKERLKREHHEKMIRKSRKKRSR